MRRESFNRMLAQETVPTTQPHATRDERDPLVAAIVVPPREGVPAQERAPTIASGSPGNPAVQGFARPTKRQPCRFTAERPHGLSTNTPIAAIVLPLMRANQFTVVNVARVTHRRVASARATWRP